MADLSAMSTEELMRMRGEPPRVDLSKMSTEELMRMRSGETPSKSLIQKSLEITTSPLEMGLSIGTGIAGSAVGSVMGLIRGVTGGKYGTPEGAKEAQARAGEVAQMLTYQPRGEIAQEGMSTIGSLLDKSKLAGIGPNEAMMMSSMPVRPAVNSAAARVQPAVQKVGDMVKRTEPEMVGVGAAETGQEAMRRAKAESLPVPVKLSKGEASRNFEQQRFERETAKEGSQAGQVLRQHGVDENLNLTKNLEWFLDETGAVAPSARVSGSTVDDALRSRSELLKAKYKDAYNRAKEAGELVETVDPTPLLQFVAKNASSAELAPVLKAIEAEVVRLGGGTKGGGPNAVFAQNMSLNDVENLRKMVVRLSKKDETNGFFGGEANKIIDTMTEGKGGNLYQEARQLFKDHAGEFKNQGAIKKLLGTKPGTTDRSVALEDVFRHSILSGSADDTAAIFRSLEQAGPKGRQAIAELKGDTVKYLQEQASKNSVKDVNGNPILSYKALNSAVKELEIDGKLEFLFGKKGAQQIRDITDIVGDLNVAPAGVVNQSTTAAVLKEALGAALVGRLPTATLKTVQGVKSAVKDYRSLRLAKEAIEPPQDPHVVRPAIH